MKKIVWFISGAIYLTGFFIIAPFMKILDWRGSDLAFLIFFNLWINFFPLSLSCIYKKIK